MGAEFLINDSGYANLGYDAEHSEELTLTLEDGAGLDAATVVYSVVLASYDAPELVFSPSTGIPATPTGTVTVTMPGSGVHSYRIQCQINGGRDTNGHTVRDYTKERIVAIRSTNLGLRKMVPGETTEYHAAGWHEEQNRAVDLLDTYGLGGAEFPFPFGITFPTDATFAITQARAAEGSPAADAVIEAQAAAIGSEEGGARLMLSGGEPDTADYLTGDVAVNTGASVGGESAGLVLSAGGGADIAKLAEYGGEMALRVLTAIGLRMISSVSVMLQTATQAATLSETQRKFEITGIKQLVKAAGQFVKTPTGSNPISGNYALDFDVSDEWEFTLGGNTTFDAPTNVQRGTMYSVKITQNGTGGHTLSWHSNFKFGSHSGTPTATANAVDFFIFKGGSGGLVHCIATSKGVHA